MILFLNGWPECGDNQIAYLGVATGKPGLTPLAGYSLYSYSLAVSDTATTDA